MSLERKVSTQIKKKQAEIQRLEAEIAEIESSLLEARAYLQALEDLMKHVPKEGKVADADTAAVRPGGSVDQAIKLLEAYGSPMHVNDMLDGLGKDSNKKNRRALSAQLAAYVRQKRIFTRPAPNTYGLVDWAGKGTDRTDSDMPDDAQPPEGFGKIRSVG